MDNSNFTAQYPQDQQLEKARTSLRKSLERVTNNSALINPENQATREQLTTTLSKLDRGIYSIAVFGLVSRGKSAVLNALIGEKILETGPLNGLTKFPRSIHWKPTENIEVDLIDTPGLDEIDGEERAKMAEEVARRADLILFIIAGDITQIEYQSLCALRNAKKPLILVFNKADLYPETSRLEIYEQLQNLTNNSEKDQLLQRLLSAEEVVMISAEPTPIKVRIEDLDGTIKYQWEQPKADIQPLKDKILTLLTAEGKSLLAINALIQAREADNNHAFNTLGSLKNQAEKLIWQFAQYKALGVAINPIPLFDLLGGLLVDLALIRALAKLYNLPLTNYEITKLWGGIIFSSGALLLAEFATGALFSIGKGSAIVSTGLHPLSIFNYIINGIIQGAIAGYGSFRVGQVTAVYLASGCSWGKFGSNQIIQEIFQELPKETIISRLEEELTQKQQK